MPKRSSEMADWQAYGMREHLIDRFVNQQIEKRRGDESMASGAALRQAEVKGEAAATKRKPRTTNPYPQDDPRYEMFDGAWKKATLAQKGRQS